MTYVKNEYILPGIIQIKKLANSYNFALQNGSV